MCFSVIVLNSAYLATFSEASLFHVANLLLHVSLGTMLVVYAIVALARLLAKKFEVSRQWQLVAAALSLAAASGLYLAWVGNLRAMRPLLQAHGIAAVIFVLLATYAFQRRALTAVVAACLLGTIAFSVQRQLRPENAPFNVGLPPLLSAEAMGGPEGPFYPSSASTRDGRLIPAKFFMQAESCAGSGCHRDIYEQWKSSAHHFASFNNQWYRKSIEYMQSVIGVQPSKWCGGCHDHAVLFSGLMDKPVATYVSRPEAQAGLTCVSCHAIIQVNNTVGNGGFTIEYPSLDDLAASKNPFVRRMYHFVLRLDPAPHRQTFLKPFHQGENSTFCSSCHKVHLDQPVNHYHWIRGFDEYDRWQASGISGEGALAFYYPKEPKTCSTCHMPLVPSQDAGNQQGMIHSHRFIGANTALPVAYEDETQLKATMDFLKKDQLSIDIFALVRDNKEQAAGKISPTNDDSRVNTTRPSELTAPLDNIRPALIRGESVRIDVVVRTRNVGHAFPGGTVDAQEAWVELVGADNTGRVIFWSGRVQNDGYVDPAAHFYRSILLDGHGNPINKRNAWAARSTVYARVIPPGAADSVHYRLFVPKNVASAITLKAKVNYRKFSWWNTQWAYSGVRDPGVPRFALGPHYDDGAWVFNPDLRDVSGRLKHPPDLPIVTLAQAEVTLPVSDHRKNSQEEDHADPAQALRWNDYGIGLLLQGDSGGAERAFLKVTELNPAYGDGWVNVARARLQQGDLEGARSMLEKALSLSPNLAKAHFLYGTILRGLSNYDQALKHFQEAAASYPKDKQVCNQIARVYLLQKQYDRAIAEYEKTITIDPEDLEAYYNVMLAFNAKGGVPTAQQKEWIEWIGRKQQFLLFRREGGPQAFDWWTKSVGDYLGFHPLDNNERQPIHEHRTASMH